MRLLISVLFRCKHSVKPSCTLSFTFCHLNMSRCVLSWEWNGTRPSGTTRPAAQIRPSDFVIFDLSFCTNERKMGISYERPATSHCLNQCWNIDNRTLGKKNREIFMKFIHFHSVKCICKSPGTWRLFCLGLNVLTKNSRHLLHNIFKCIFVSEFRLQFHWSFCPIDNKSPLVWIMAWHLMGDEPLSEPMIA